MRPVVRPPLAVLIGALFVGCSSPGAEGPTGAPATPPPSASPDETHAAPSARVAPSASAVVEAPPPPRRCYPPNDGGPRDDGFRIAGWPIYKATLTDDGCNLAVANSMGEMLYVDVSTSKILARVRPIGSERDIPTVFIDDTRVAFCGDTDFLHFWDGRSQPVDVVKLPMPPPTGCRAIFADRRNQRIALLIGGDMFSEQRKLVVMDYAGRILAEHAAVGDSYAAFSGEWFSWFQSPKRRFLHWSDPAAKPVSEWPTGVRFDGLGAGPIGIHGRPPDPIGLEDLSSESAKNPQIPLDRGVPYNGTFSGDGKYAAIFYRADLPSPQKPKAKTGLALFDPAFGAEVAFTPIAWASDYAWIHGGETLVYLYSMEVRFLDVPSLKAHGAISAGKQ